jgi:hypothetical protein
VLLAIFVGASALTSIPGGALPAAGATSDLIMIDAFGTTVTTLVTGQSGYKATFPAPTACPESFDVFYDDVEVIFSQNGSEVFTQLASVDFDGSWSIAEGVDFGPGMSIKWQCTDSSGESPDVVLGNVTPPVDAMPTFSAPLSGTVGSTITVSAVGACHPGSTVGVGMSSGFETDPSANKTATVPGTGMWSVQLTVPALGTGKTSEAIRAACYDTGPSGYAQQYPGRTFTPTSTTTAPGPPRSVVAKPGSTTSTTTGPIVVSYLAPSSTGGSAISKYTVTCASSNSGVTKTVTRNSGSVAPITVTGATLKKTYTCKVTATNATGTGIASSASPSIVVGAPAQVSKPTLTKPASGRLKVSFTNLTGAQANGSPLTSPKYSATCASSNGGVTKSATGTGTPITVTGLTPGKTYTCQIRAHNARGYGRWSPASGSHLA